MIVVSALSGLGTGGEGKHLGGDYPAFYGAGTLAREGAWDRLYEDSAQQEAQEGLVDDSGGFLYFAYPPPVAAIYAPLSAVPYRWSYLIHTALMALILGLAVALARPLFPPVDRYPLASYAVAMVSYPLFRAVTGGQNSALTLLLVVAVARFVRDERELAAGLAAGLMLYKPQFGVVVLALLALERKWKAIGVGVAVAGTWWLGSAALVGVGWLGTWLDQAVAFSELDSRVNSANLVSLRGALHHQWGDAGSLIGWTLAGALLVFLAVWWYRNSGPAWAPYLVAAGAAVAVLPRSLFYEAALAIPVVLLIGRPKPRRAMLWAGATWSTPLLGDYGSTALLGLVLVAVVSAGLSTMGVDGSSRRAMRSASVHDAAGS